MNSKGIVISCFDESTVMVKPWARAGYECYCVDLMHPKGANVFLEHDNGGVIYKVGCDMNEYFPPRGNIVFASFFPPCTHVSRAGCNAWKDKGLGKLIEALRLFKVSIDLAEWCNCPYLIENPVGTVSTYWRKPDHYFEPYWFGDGYSKMTCLWIGGGFVMPDVRRENIVMPVKAPKHQNSMDLYHRNLGQFSGDIAVRKRSQTPKGFAEAVFEANINAKANYIVQREKKKVKIKS